MKKILIILLLLPHGIHSKHKDDPAKYKTVGGAAVRGYLKRVKHLIEVEGLSVDQRSSLERTPLMEASSKGYLDIVLYLLSKGAKVNAYSCSCMLLTAGNGVSSYYHGGNALHDAAAGGYLEVVRVLIDSGIDVHWTDMSGTRAVDYALTYGHKEVMDYIWNKMQP